MFDAQGIQFALVAAIPLLGRTVPVLGYSLVSSGRAPLWRVAWMASLVASYATVSTLAPTAGFVLIDVALSNAWLLVVALLLYLYARYSPDFGGLGRLLDAGLTVGCALVVPLAVFPHDMWPLVGPMSWEFCLAGYSYVQRARGQVAQQVGDSLFFLMVNPMLVFSGHRERGHTNFASWRVGAARILGGYLTIYAALWLQRLAQGHLSNGWVLVVFLVVQYGTHSGRASQDVGIMRMLGYPIPERYHYPFLAKSPQDFWTRWNAYVGTWAREHLFFPANRAARRVGVPRRYAPAVAVLATFGAIGAMHESIGLWAPELKPFGFTSWFLLNGLLLLLWRAAESLHVNQDSRVTRLVGTVARVSAFLGMGLAAQKFLT